eukprot:GHVU01220786.1.p2 GENE.GHVU01220786.1~~GHVU01220786.1.p2  ORF type:complete len:111 (+),score=16.30 GHVU01220786.1:1184-1516(+)
MCVRRRACSGAVQPLYSAAAEAEVPAAAAAVQSSDGQPDLGPFRVDCDSDARRPEMRGPEMQEMAACCINGRLRLMCYLVVRLPYRVPKVVAERCVFAARWEGGCGGRRE